MSVSETATKAAPTRRPIGVQLHPGELERRHPDPSWTGYRDLATFSEMDRFEASALTHMFVVADVERSRDWYVRVLDARVFGEYGGQSVVLDLLGNWILLVTGGGPDAGKPGITLAPPQHPDHPSAQLIFRVDDCVGLCELLASRGAEFLSEPHVRDGETRAFFRDPDGHLFEISQLT